MNLTDFIISLTRDITPKVICDRCKAESITNLPGDTCYVCKKGVMK